MKVLLTTAAVAVSTLPMLAQAGERGVSRPDNTPIVATGDQAPSLRKPSPDNVDANALTSLPATQSTAIEPMTQDDASAFHPYHPGDAPYRGSLASRPATPSYASAPVALGDPDGDIVTSVPVREGEMAEGTLLKVRMNDALSTQRTLRGTPFSATIVEDVLREGVVVIPAGSVLNGNVTEVRGGRRIAGRAAIHLDPRRVTLPDGRYFILHAQVIEAGEEHAVRVDGEGTIVRRDHPKEMLAVASLTTGSAAAAGAVLGGGVGALVGAGIGAGVSTVIWLKQDRQAALPKDTALIFSLTTPMMLQTMLQTTENGASLRP